MSSLNSLPLLLTAATTTAGKPPNSIVLILADNPVRVMTRGINRRTYTLSTRATIGSPYDAGSVRVERLIVMQSTVNGDWT